jgi:hypothetical protein
MFERLTDFCEGERAHMENKAGLRVRIALCGGNRLSEKTFLSGISHTICNAIVTIFV